jgi:hypothetical protein
MYATESINMVSNSSTPTQTPNELVTGKKVDASFMFRAEFGAVGLFRVPYSDAADINARAEFGVVVGRVGNSNGILKVFVPERNRIVRRFKFIRTQVTADFQKLLLQHEEDTETDDTDESEWDDSDISELNVPINEVSDDFEWNLNDVWEPLIEDFENEADVVVNMTLDEASKKHPDLLESSVKLEIDQMIKLNVWQPVKSNEIIKQFKDEAVPSHMIVKMKVDSNGEPDKLKSRLVAGGHKQIQEKGVDNSSPTVDLKSFFILIGIIANKNLRFACCDVAGAYLQASLKNKNQYMRMSSNLSKILVKQYPKYLDYVDDKGNIYVKLNKALYGLKESAKCWYENLAAFILSIGFKVSIHDHCLFYRVDGDEVTYVICHVDDILIAATHDSLIEEFFNDLRNKYNDIVVQTGQSISYLGLSRRYYDG